MGVDENIANVLAGFKIMLSPDRHEVVKIVVYYIWCVEGEHYYILPAVFSPASTAPESSFRCAETSCRRIHNKLDVILLQCVTYLP